MITLIEMIQVAFIGEPSYPKIGVRIESIIQPRMPHGLGWRACESWSPPKELASLGYPVQAWENMAWGVFVLSAVEVTDEPGKPKLGPEYHISISANGKRCSSSAARMVLAAFRLEDATEDNHVPSGKVRNFWRPVADNLSGYECPCAETEPTIREDKGDYVWRGL